MTKTEAMEILTEVRAMDDSMYAYAPCYDEALDMAIEALKAQEQENAIPIDWLMRYAQLPTEYAIAEWQKPKRETWIKQIRSRDKPMSFDDALQLVNDQKEAPWLGYVCNMPDWYCADGKRRESE